MSPPPAPTSSMNDLTAPSPGFAPCVAALKLSFAFWKSDFSAGADLGTSPADRSMAPCFGTSPADKSMGEAAIMEPPDNPVAGLLPSLRSRLHWDWPDAMLR